MRSLMSEPRLGDVQPRRTEMAGTALPVAAQLGLNVSDLRKASSLCHLSAVLGLTDTEGSLQRLNRPRKIPRLTLLACVAGEFFRNSGNLLASCVSPLFLLCP